MKVCEGAGTEGLFISNNCHLDWCLWMGPTICCGPFPTDHSHPDWRTVDDNFWALVCCDPDWLITWYALLLAKVSLSSSNHVKPLLHSEWLDS